MPIHVDACLANARRCSQIAKSTRSLDDKCEFQSFAASWLRLANEIESHERLIALIDGLAASTPSGEEADPEFDAFATCHLSSLQRLATAVLSVSHHFMGNAKSPEVEELGPTVSVAAFVPAKQSSG